MDLIFFNIEQKKNFQEKKFHAADNEDFFSLVSNSSRFLSSYFYWKKPKRNFVELKFEVHIFIAAILD